MGFIKNTLKGVVVAKVASEARKPSNQAKAKSALSSLAARFSGKPATPVKGRKAATRGTTTTRGTSTRGTVTKGRATKATSRPR